MNKLGFFGLYLSYNADILTFNEYVLELKSLHSITLKDAKAIIAFRFSMDESLIDFEVTSLKIEEEEDGLHYRFIFEYDENNLMSFGLADYNLVDYLRSKGYAIPYGGKSVSELVHLGWMKIKK